MTIRNAILGQRWMEAKLTATWPPGALVLTKPLPLAWASSACMHRVFSLSQEDSQRLHCVMTNYRFLNSNYKWIHFRGWSVSFCMLFTYLASVQRKPTKRGILQWGPWKWNLFRPVHVVSVAKLIIYTLSGQRYSLLWPSGSSSLSPWPEYLWTFLVQLA